jgi:hypothetical protein
MMNADSVEQGLEDFNRVYDWMIRQAEEWLNQSDDGTIEPTLVFVRKDNPDTGYVWDAMEFQMKHGFSVNDIDLRTATRDEYSWVLFCIYVESVWMVLRVVDKSQLHQKPLDASTQEDRQRCVQIRIATSDVFAVANSPLCFTRGSWTLKKTRLVFPSMAMNGTGDAVYRAGADA